MSIWIILCDTSFWCETPLFRGGGPVLYYSYNANDFRLIRIAFSFKTASVYDVQDTTLCIGFATQISTSFSSTILLQTSSSLLVRGAYLFFLNKNYNIIIIQNFKIAREPRRLWVNPCGISRRTRNRILRVSTRRVRYNKSWARQAYWLVGEKLF